MSRAIISAAERSFPGTRAAGHMRRAANGHLVMRAIRHGVAGWWIDELELPSYMGVLRAGRPPA